MLPLVSSSANLSLAGFGVSKPVGRTQNSPRHEKPVSRAAKPGTFRFLVSQTRRDSLSASAHFEQTALVRGPYFGVLFIFYH